MSTNARLIPRVIFGLGASTVLASAAAFATPAPRLDTAVVAHDPAPRAEARSELLPAPTTRYLREGDDVDVSFAVVASGVRYEALDLPPGLTLEAASGVVSGHLGPQSAGQYVTTLRATSDTRVETITFTWVVLDVTLPQIASPGVQINRGGDDVDLALSATEPDGDALTFSAAGLPRGLAIDPRTGRITGRLAAHELRTTYGLTVAASDGQVTGGTVFTWIVLPNAAR
jgi:hypothetical protein